MAKSIFQLGNWNVILWRDQTDFKDVQEKGL